MTSWWEQWNAILDAPPEPVPFDVDKMVRALMVDLGLPFAWLKRPPDRNHVLLAQYER